MKSDGDDESRCKSPITFSTFLGVLVLGALALGLLIDKIFIRGGNSWEL